VLQDVIRIRGKLTAYSSDEEVRAERQIYAIERNVHHHSVVQCSAKSRAQNAPE
jgi:hypothetical protein